MYTARLWVYNSWNVIMNAKFNPLKGIQDMQARHLIMQILAWMWCITFSMFFSSMWVFGLTTVAHIFIIAAIVITVKTFERVQDDPQFYLHKGYHTTSRSRQIMYLSGHGKMEMIELPPGDPGGEHE